MIYAPSERPLLDPIVKAFITNYSVEIRMAPLGIQAGTLEWRSNVEAEMNKCEAALILITANSVKDETVGWRFQLAMKLNLTIIPIVIDMTGEEERISYDMPIPELKELFNFNWFSIHHLFINVAIDNLAMNFRLSEKQRSIFCFISYSRRDSQFAEKLGDDLRNVGVSIWRDVENIAAGSNWDREIEKAIKSCSHLILVASRNSVVSENVLDEVSLALEKGKTVVPLLLETCDLPLRVHRTQWIDFRDDYSSALGKLFEQLSINSKQAKVNLLKMSNDTRKFTNILRNVLRKLLKISY